MSAVAGRHERLCSPTPAKRGRSENLPNRQVAVPFLAITSVAVLSGI